MLLGDGGGSRHGRVGLGVDAPSFFKIGINYKVAEFRDDAMPNGEAVAIMLMPGLGYEANVLVGSRHRGYCIVRQTIVFMGCG